MRAAKLGNVVTASEAWHCEKLEETVGEGAASIAVKAPGLKGS